jgi:CheY-like chemotaxis protein
MEPKVELLLPSLLPLSADGIELRVDGVLNNGTIAVDDGAVDGLATSGEESSVMQVGAVAGTGQETAPEEMRNEHVLGRRRRRVLVVEDDPLSGQVASVMLTRLGFHPILVTNGADALQVLCSVPPVTGLPHLPGRAGAEEETEIQPGAGAGLEMEAEAQTQAQTPAQSKDVPPAAAPPRFCCVLMDMGLPDMDGITITKRLRQWEAVQAGDTVPSSCGKGCSSSGYRTPVIALTAFTLDNAMERLSLLLSSLLSRSPPYTPH